MSGLDERRKGGDSKTDGAASPDLDDSIEHIAALQRQHELSTTATQRMANWVTAKLGRPGTLTVIVLMMIVWMCGNYGVHRLGASALEEFPFPDLAFVATIAALLIALLILTTQQHENQLADRRAQLTLQIAILSEKKVAKVIELLEEQRRDNPMLASRVDDEAESMVRSVNPSESLEKPGQVCLMPAVTYYVAIPFSRDEEGNLLPGEAKECPNGDRAKRMAQSMADKHAGAIAFSRSGDPATATSKMLR